jgi:hypothetical protein
MEDVQTYVPRRHLDTSCSEQPIAPRLDRTWAERVLMHTFER